MKSVLWCVFFILFVTPTQGQTTFNKRLHFGFPAAVLTSVIATDSCYYATGIVVDSIQPHRSGNIFVKFDLDGNVIYHKTLIDSIKTFEIWNPTLQQTSGNNFVAAGYTIGTTGLKTLLLKFTPDGDTLFSKTYASFFGDDLFVRLEDFRITPDSGFIFVNSARNPEGLGNHDITTIKTDSLGNVEWHRVYGSLYMGDFPKSVINDDNGYVIGANRNNGSTVDNNFTSRYHLFKIDFQGEMQWEHFSSNTALYDGANDIIKHPNGGWIILSRKGIEVAANPNWGILEWDNYIFSLTVNRTLRWGTFFRDSMPVRLAFNYLNRIISLPEDEEFVAVGNIVEIDPDYERHNGLLVKVSSSGDSIWSRYYHYVESALHRHYLYDLKQAPDGGFIMVGQARDFEQSPQGQQAWLLKVDEFGCLVPGCHLVNSTEDLKGEVNLSLYPNPTSDYLNFYFNPGPQKENTQFRITDNTGRIIKIIDSDRMPTTYIVPVYDYSSGIYFLQVLVEGKIAGTKNFVILNKD